jgi:phage tail sheath protein FI
MPVNPTYPGVYIEEVPSGVRTIVGVSTSVAAFIGSFSRGPLNHPIQIFNEGDLQREFGGLRADSETSYAVSQFFLNGGSEAWVVRTALTEGDDAAEASSANLQDEDGNDTLVATAGRQIKDEPFQDPGEWGDFVRIDVDYNTNDPATEFNLTITEISNGNGPASVVQTETYRNLTMDETLSNHAVAVVNASSKLIFLNQQGDNRPAATGSLSTDASNALEGGDSAVSSSDSFVINFPDGSSAIATLNFEGNLTTLSQLRTVLQSAIRSAVASDQLAEPNMPLLRGSTVELNGNRLRILTNRNASNYDPAMILTFGEDDGGTTAAALGLGDTASNNVQQYILEDGSDGALADADALVGNRDGKTGMFALEDVDIFNILAIPETATADPENAEAMSQVIVQAEEYCEERRAFFIVDLPPPPTINTMQEARDWLEDNAGLRHKNAAAYFPRPRIPDPLNDFRMKSVGASGTIAGLFARTDSNRGVWKAPAGIEGQLRNVPELDYKLTDPENGQLNPLGLNCLRNFDVFGNVCWGARTLVGADQLASEWKYIPVRRLALFLEESLYRGTHWVVFEPNDEPLWAQIRLNIGAFMQNLFRQGAFQGKTPREAYLVKCDSETTTQNDINLGIVNILVGFAPLKPAEFVIIKIQQLAGQIQT